MEDLSWKDCEHFLRLVRQGGHHGCSGCEAAARKLAVAIREAAGRLDDEAITGAVVFMGLCERYPSRCRDLLEAVGVAGGR